MAATSTKLTSALIVKYKDGKDENGKEIIKKQRLSNVKPKAVEQDIFDVAKAIEKILGKTIDEVLRDDESGIMNE